MLPLVLAANTELDEARAAFQHLQCPQAITAATAAENSNTLSDTELEEMWWVQARCFLSAGNRRSAEGALLKLLRDNPSFAVDEQESPKVREAVEAVRSRLYPKAYVALEPQVSTSARERFRLVDPWRQVTRVVLRSRSQASAPFDTTVLVPDRLVYAIDQPMVDGKQWFVEALSDSQVVLAHVATEQAPRGSVLAAPNVTVSKPEEPAVTPPSTTSPAKPTRAIGWGLGAGAVIAAAVGAGLMASAFGLEASAKTQMFGSDVRRLNEQANLQSGFSIGLFVTAGVLTALALIVGLQ